MCLVRGFATSNSVFTINSVGFLMLSSTLGIVIGDILWLEALRLLGAKHVIVIDSLKPFVAAILGRLGLGEVLKAPAWGGMVLTVIGVGVVAWEEQRLSAKDADSNRRSTSDTEDADRTGSDKQKQETMPVVEAVDIGDGGASDMAGTASSRTSTYRRGYACAVINVLADALGSLLTKQHGAGMTTWTVNLIRFGFAGVIMACVSASMRLRRHISASEGASDEKSPAERGDDLSRRDSATTAAKKENIPLWFELPTLPKIGWLQILAGVLCVTFLCPALSNYALFQISLGLAVALGSIGPLYGLLLDWPFKGRRPTLTGCAGVTLATAGVVVLCFWGS